MYNPSLREQPRDQRAPVIPLQHEFSILDWLEGTGRLLARDSQEYAYPDEDDPEISDLMAVDDGAYDLDDDEDDVLDLEE